jgi:hypothetical protein
MRPARLAVSVGGRGPYDSARNNKQQSRDAWTKVGDCMLTLATNWSDVSQLCHNNREGSRLDCGGRDRTLRQWGHGRLPATLRDLTRTGDGNTSC